MTLELWSDPENDGERSCCSAQAVRSAREIAHGLGMPHLSIDLREEFRAGVVDGWLADHAAGLTPNPCVRCNGNVRLDAMLELAERLGRADAGHRSLRAHGSRGSAPGRCCAWRVGSRARIRAMRCARSRAARSARLRFPLGELTKPEVRELAARAGLEVARKPDSQDLCFLAGTGRTRLPRAPRRAGQRAGRDRRPRRARAGRARRRAHRHRRPAPRPGELGARRAAVRARHRRAPPTRSRSGRARSCARRRVSVRDVTLHRDGAVSTREGALPRAHGCPLALTPVRGAGQSRTRSRSSWPSRSSAPRPGRSRACIAGESDRRPRHDRLRNRHTAQRVASLQVASAP